MNGPGLGPRPRAQVSCLVSFGMTRHPRSKSLGGEEDLKLFGKCNHNYTFK
uniref:Uncharacterized protein n=1 Tax=Moschus moschiferus TaxID=68415 RepID=A0A8C6D8Z9_MOSMO